MVGRNKGGCLGTILEEKDEEGGEEEEEGGGSGREEGVSVYHS